MDALIETLFRLWSGVAVHVWQTTILLAFLWAVSGALRTAPAKLVHGLWTVALLKLIVPAALIGTLLGLNAAPPTWSAAVLAPVHAVLSPEVDVHPGAGTSAPSLALLLWTLAWAGVAGIRVSRLLITGRKDGATPLEPTPAEHARVARVAKEAGMDPARVRVSDEVLMPQVVGLLRPHLLLPRWTLSELDGNALRAVVAHEAGHVSRRDPLRRFVARIVCALFWFYPPVTWVCRRLDRSAELVCDESVLARGISGRALSRAVATTIRRAWSAPVAPLAVGLDGDRFLSVRFKRILESRRYRVTSRHWVVVGMMAVVTAFATLVPALATSEEVRGEDKSSHAGVTEFDIAPKPLHTVAPEYPKSLRDDRVEGIVYVQARIDKKGAVSHTEIQTRKDVERAHARFEEAALAAAAQWTFEPATKDGEPVSVEIVIPFKFALPKDE